MGWIVKSRFRTVLVILIFLGVFVVSIRSFVKTSASPPGATSELPLPATGAPYRPEEKHSVLPLRPGNRPLPTRPGSRPGPGRTTPTPAPSPSQTPEDGQSSNTLSLVTAIVSMLGTLSTIYFAWADRRDKRMERRNNEVPGV
jgi:hypothetical protein